MTGFISEMRRSGNGLVLRVSVIAAIGGLLFGYDTGVIPGADETTPGTDPGAGPGRAT